MKAVFESWKVENKEFCKRASKDAISILFAIDGIIGDMEYIKSLQMNFGDGFNLNDLNRVKIKVKVLEIYLNESFNGTNNKIDTGINLLQKNPSTPFTVFF